MIPIEYSGVVIDAAGVEHFFELDAPGWLTTPELLNPQAFTLKPKADAELPVISVHLVPLEDGTPRRLVYFSRVYGQVKTNAAEEVSDDSEPLFRIYCVGWSAMIAGRALRVMNWVYPGGSVVVADEPPYVNEMIEHYAAARRALAEAPAVG